MPQITARDISLKDCKLTDRVKRLKSEYFRAFPEVCTERPRNITRFHLKEGLFNKDRISILDKARAYRDALEERTSIIHHDIAYEKGMNPFKPEGRSLAVRRRSPVRPFSLRLK